MNYEQAKVFGDRGEAIVARILAAHCGEDERIVNDVLLDGVDTTTQIDHMFIDRFGVLIVETKTYRALIKGSSDDKTWTACYAGGKHQSFHNPLRQNESHRKKLTRVLQQNDLRLDPHYIQSVIVFADGRVDELTLSDEDRARVVDAEGFAAHLATRADFAPNPGGVTPSMVASIAHMLDSLNRVDDATVQARHGEMVKAASGRGGKGKRPRQRSGRPNSMRNTPRPHGKSQDDKASLAASAFLALIVILLIMGSSGFWTIFDAVAAGFDAWTRPAATAPTPTPTINYDVSQALARVREADARTYAALVNPNNPRLSTRNGLATYTWPTRRSTPGGGIAVSTFSVTLDEAGAIVGTSSR